MRMTSWVVANAIVPAAEWLSFGGIRGMSLLCKRILLAAFAIPFLWPSDSVGLVIYRIGTPFTVTEKDSLSGAGIDYREISWSSAHLLSDLDQDSLNIGTLRPNFFGADVNLAASTLDRGGVVRVFLFASENTTIGNVLIDEDPNTIYTWEAIDPDQFANSSFGWNKEKEPETITIDLGGEFLIKEVRFRPLASHPEHYLDEFRIGVGDEYKIRSRGAGLGSIFFDPIFERVENDEPDVQAFLNPPVVTRLIQLQVPRVTPKELCIAEFEVYGGGFTSHSIYESDVIEMEDVASWGQITWSGVRDDEAQVEIRSRAGVDPHPEVFWQARPEQQDSVQYLRGGGDLSFTGYKAAYAKLSEFLKPVEQEDWMSPDTENWSYWSSAYAFDYPDADIVSPGPRKYFQIKADFFSTLEDGGKIDYIEFKASVPPAVHRLVGEISPTVCAIGVPTQFTYYIRPTIRGGDNSFDQVEITTPSTVVSVDSVRLDGIDTDFSWTYLKDSLGFDVKLPQKLGTEESGALLEVVFTVSVLREVGTMFSGKVSDANDPHEVRQPVIAGNAADEIEGDQLLVTTALSNSLLLFPQVRPSSFTPNGDGINDVVELSYKLLRLTSPVPVAIEISDLSGKRVRKLYTGRDALGEYVHYWDGRDDVGDVVLPGLYLYKFVVELQAERETHSGIVAVAY